MSIKLLLTILYLVAISQAGDNTELCTSIKVEDCKKCTHCMKQSFLQKAFDVFDSYGFAPRFTIEMNNRIVGTKTPAQYCEPNS